MAEQVGLARNFTIEWLDAAADCQVIGKDKAEAHAHLDNIIGEKIQSKDNIRKTRTIMLNLWYGNEPWIQTECIDTCKDIARSERLPLHWALLMSYYPVFFDLCSVIGSLLEYRDVVTLQQIKARIFEKWGARTTLEHSLSKNMQSLKDVGAMIPQQGSGTYAAAKYTVDNKRIVYVLAEAILKNEQREYMTWEEIIHHPALFPFDVENVTQGDMASCDRFALERMGDDVVIRRR
jgi:hypothetical protein